MGKERISEKQLIIPSLKLFSIYPDGVTTSELIKLLEYVMQPKGKDAKIIEGRNDTFFSQKVRNLRSHSTFERYGWAEYTDNKYYITELGKRFLEDKYEEYEYINTGYFDKKSQEQANNELISNEANKYFVLEDEISEGKLITTNSKTRQRSAKLRNYAFDYYKNQNQIKCIICGFDFENAYGELGKDYIELHHIKPISIYEEDGEIKNLEEARKNLVPLCCNCHKILHRNNLIVEELKKVIDNNERQYISKRRG